MNDNSTPASDVKRFPVIIHVDMNTFYAAVERRDNLKKYAGKIIIVGQTKSPAIVVSADYLARAKGVKAGMPIYEARQLCPKFELVEPNMPKYEKESELLMEIIRRVAGPTAVFEKVSVDEAYVDVSASCQGTDADDSLKKAVPLAWQIKILMANERHLLASVGIASERFISKLASDSCKPDSKNPCGLLLVLESEKIEFLKTFDVGKLYGVGEVTQGKLNKVGIFTVADLIGYDGDLCAVVGKDKGELLKGYVRGKDRKGIAPKGKPKQYTKQESFDRDERPVGDGVVPVLLCQAKEVAADLRKNEVLAVNVEVSVCYKFRKKGNDGHDQVKLPFPTDDMGIIFATALSLLDKNNLRATPLQKLCSGTTKVVPQGTTALECSKPKSKSKKKDADQIRLF